jgi:hypothetical protein
VKLGKYARAEHDNLSQRIHRRIRTASRERLLDYVDEAGAGINRGMDDFKKENDIRSLREIEDALVVLTVINKELILRWEAEHAPRETLS